MGILNLIVFLSWVLLANPQGTNIMHDLNIDNAVAHPLARYRNHLEFHGYHVEEEENIILGRHSRKPNLIIEAVTDRGVLVGTVYALNPKINRVQLLEYINQLNSNFLFMKAYTDDKDGFTMETFLEGGYDRTNFSLLLDNIDYDLQILYSHELTEEYLG